MVSQFDGEAAKHHNRVIPGTAKFKHPTSIAGLWKKFNTVNSFVNLNFYDRFVWQFPFLIWCTISKLADDSWKWDQTNYCYDNFVSDLNMHDGDGEANGIFGYYDLFTWEGWLDVWFWRTG